MLVAWSPLRDRCYKCAAVGCAGPTRNDGKVVATRARCGVKGVGECVVVLKMFHIANVPDFPHARTCLNPACGHLSYFVVLCTLALFWPLSGTFYKRVSLSLSFDHF